MKPFGDTLQVTKAGSLHGGRKTFVQLEIEGYSLVGTEKIKRYVTVIDSNDGSTGLSIGIGELVLSCQNQFFKFYKNGQSKYRHTASLTQRIKEIPFLIENSLSESLRLTETYKTFQSNEISRNLAHKLVKDLLGYDKLMSVNSNSDRMRDNYKILIVSVGAIIAWMVALVIALAMGGCNKQLRMNYGAEVKMHVKVDTAAEAADTVSRSRQQEQGSASTEVTEEKEAVPGGKAELELKPADLQPVTDAKGHKKGRTFTERDGSAELKVVVNKNGKTTITCQADSLEREVRRYKKDSAWQRQTGDSLAMVLRKTSSTLQVVDSSAVALEKEVTKRMPTGIVAGLAVVTFLIGLVVSKLSKFV